MSMYLPSPYGRREYIMNEMAVNSSTYMYDEVSEINQLNKVEGFDPRKYMRLIQNEGQAGKYYLDVAYRKLWFRLKYPQGKIVKKLIKLTENVAIVEARVYLDRNDEEANYISNALAQKYLTNDEKFGAKYVELAETAAVGRALSDAGFGLQFADKEMDFDPEVTEAPIDSQIMQGGSMIQDESFLAEEMTDETDGTIMEQEDENIPGQHGIEEYIPMPEEVGEAFKQGMTPAMQQAAQTPAEAVPQQNVGRAAAMPAPVRQSVKSASATRNQPIPASGKDGQTPVANRQDGIRKDMPVEEIYRMLNRDMAAAVVVSTGFNKGKTLGQVAIEKPNSLEWYVSSYAGPDNILRAAAKLLIDTAMNQAG